VRRHPVLHKFSHHFFSLPLHRQHGTDVAHREPLARRGRRSPGARRDQRADGGVAQAQRAQRARAAIVHATHVPLPYDVHLSPS
jgi:hypothetical protein